MKRKLICLLLLAVLVMAGCSRQPVQEAAQSTEPRYLTRLNFYSASGHLLDQYRIEYDPTGMPVKISSGIQQDQRYEAPLGGAPMLPEGVKLDQADRESYRAILIAPCDEGTALLVAGSAQEPLWGMVLYGDKEQYVAENGYLTKVTANDGSYVALFYSVLADASGADSDQTDNSFAVTENSAYYGYDEVLSTLGTAVLSMDQEQPASLNELLFSALYASEPNKGSIGYAFVDLDSDGVKELIVGSRGQHARSVIYDLYAIYNGRIVNVLSSTDTARHMLASDNSILLETRNDNDQNVFAAFSYYNSSVRLLEAVIQGGGERFTSSQSFTDDSTFEPVSYAEAAAIQEKYTAVEIEFTPLSTYIEDVGLTVETP